MLAVIGICLVIGFSAWVGSTQTHEGSSGWELFALVLTGLGTTLLAGVTGFLAYETRLDVRASRSTAETATRQLQLSVRPLLVTTGVSVARDGDSASVMVAFLSIGQGAAVVPMNGQMRNGRVEDTPEPAYRDGSPDKRVVIPDEFLQVSFEGLSWPPLHMYAEVVYTDIDGAQPQRTTAYIAAVTRDGYPALEFQGFKLERLAATDRNAQPVGDPVLSGEGWNLDKPGMMEH